MPPLIVAGMVALLFANVASAAACYCYFDPEMDDHVKRAVSEADVIAVGIVEELTPGQLSKRTGDLDAEVRVERYLKDSGPVRISVDDPAGTGSCGFITEGSLERRYVFFLTEHESAPYRTYLCSGSWALDEAGAAGYLSSIGALTGPGEAPPQEEAEGDGLPRAMMWAAAIALPLAFMLAAAALSSRRRL